MISVIAFLIVIGICVISHEGGHFLTAKWRNVFVHEFSFGMGPVIVSKQYGETQYSIRAFPVGGFVKLEGEDEEDDEEEKPKVKVDPSRSLANKKPWEKMVIIAAGALVNIALAWLITAIYLCSHGVYDLSTARLGTIMPNTPAYHAGIQAGDVIRTIDGAEIKQWSDIRKNIQRADKQGEKFNITVERNGKNINYAITIYGKSGGRLLGVQPWLVRYSPVRAVISSFSYSWQCSVDILYGMWLTITRQIKADVAGPVGIAEMSGNAFRDGIWAFISFLGLINLNLGLLNLLPFPALDGGRLVFIAIEFVTGHKVPQKYETAVHTVGIWILLGLIALVTCHDVYKLLLR